MTDFEIAKKLLTENGWKADITSDVYRKDNKIIDGLTLTIDPQASMAFAGLEDMFKYRQSVSKNGHTWEDEFYITEPMFKDTACRHDWVKYTGLNEVYHYCRKCDEKKNA